MQASGVPEEDPTGRFDLSGWTAIYWDEAMRQALGRIFSGPFDLLVGRKTYETFAAHRPHVGADDPLSAPFTQAAEHVLTRGAKGWSGPTATVRWTLTPWRHSRQAMDRPADSGQQQPLSALFAAGLTDRLFTMHFPVVLGCDKPLFGARTQPFAPKLLSHAVSTTGVSICTYKPVGPVPTGCGAKVWRAKTDRLRRPVSAPGFRDRNAAMGISVDRGTVADQLEALALTLCGFPSADLSEKGETD
ncbi:MAG: dihydrofolate reductase [Rhodobacteraceae bacterium]|nr:dihydrofolate reductase [Paracoccaceae bacterium]